MKPFLSRLALAACLFLPSTLLAQAPVLMTYSAEKAETEAFPEIMQEAQEVYLKNVTKRGLFRKRYDKRALITVSPEQVESFREAGFQAPKKVWAKIVWDRVSNINGYGTGVNGKVTRSWNAELGGGGEADQAEMLSFIESLSSNWIEATQETYPRASQSLWSKQQTHSFERGFRVRYSFSVYAKSRIADSPELVGSKHGTTGYYSLW